MQDGEDHLSCTLTLVFTRRIWIHWNAAPVVINTSLNRRGEPIVNTAEQAYAAYEAMDLDAIVIENNDLNDEKLSVEVRRAFREFQGE